MERTNVNQFIGQNLMNNLLNGFQNAPSQPSVMPFLFNLQQNYIKQQLLLKLLLIQRQNNQEFPQPTSYRKETNIIVKAEEPMVEEKQSQTFNKIPLFLNSSFNSNFKTANFELSPVKFEATNQNESFIAKREISMETEATLQDLIQKKIWNS